MYAENFMGVWQHITDAVCLISPNVWRCQAYQQDVFASNACCAKIPDWPNRLVDDHIAI